MQAITYSEDNKNILREHLNKYIDVVDCPNAQEAARRKNEVLDILVNGCPHETELMVYELQNKHLWPLVIKDKVYNDGREVGGCTRKDIIEIAYTNDTFSMYGSEARTSVLARRIYEEMVHFTDLLPLTNYLHQKETAGWTELPERYLPIVNGKVPPRPIDINTAQGRHTAHLKQKMIGTTKSSIFIKSDSPEGRLMSLSARIATECHFNKTGDGAYSKIPDEIEHKNTRRAATEFLAKTVSNIYSHRDDRLADAKNPPSTRETDIQRIAQYIAKLLPDQGSAARNYLHLRDECIAHMRKTSKEPLFPPPAHSSNRWRSYIGRNLPQETRK